MKRILGIAVVLGLVGALTVVAQEVKPGKVEAIDLGKGVKLEMVLVSAGKFMMGGPEKDHEVTLTKPFYMGKYEVTQEQWESVMGKNPSDTKGAKLPVTNVSWNDCQDFIKKLNAKTNGGYRLPTEAEWEYSCRAGTTTAYSYGDNLTKGDANISGDSIKKVDSIKEVRSYKPNAFGLYDMHGNVWEWCEDWYADYQAGAVTDPKGPATGSVRVLRGGSFNYYVSNARSSNRYSITQSVRYHGYGFRLAKTADIKATVAEPTVPIPGSTELTPATKGLLVAPFSEVKAKEVQKSVAKSLKAQVEEKAELGKGVNLEMVLIPAGKFKMGSPVTEQGRSDNETQHEVTLTKPFYMGKYEVTQEQWESVMGKNPSDTKGAKLPVTNVSWEDCQEFIKKLNAKTDGGYRLPTESEWEYACRAGTTTAYSFGDKITPKDANYDDSKIRKPVAVGSYKPNAFGLYDMHGNVWEWCEDWYGDYPKGPATGSVRVLRGGSFDYIVSLARSSFRYYYSPTNRDVYYGFRLAKTADIKATVAEPTVPIPGSTELTPATKGLLVAPFSEVKAKEAQKQLAKSLQKEVEDKADLGKDVKLEMVLIPAGKFMMGSPASEKGRSKVETQHEVTLTKPYYMGKYEVTQEQWEAVMGDNPSKIKGGKLPVTNISWKDCHEFIKKLNKKTNGEYRLPSEAEWEFACRAGTTTAYSFGDNITPKDAIYGGSAIGAPAAIGSYKPNAFGLYDIHGNVWEWCEDWFKELPQETTIDPKGPATSIGRVLRGGSFWWESSVRSSSRADFPPTSRNFDFGFRLARTP